MNIDFTKSKNIDLLFGFVIINNIDINKLILEENKNIPQWLAEFIYLNSSKDLYVKESVLKFHLNEFSFLEKTLIKIINYHCQYLSHHIFKLILKQKNCTEKILLKLAKVLADPSLFKHVIKHINSTINVEKVLLNRNNNFIWELLAQFSKHEEIQLEHTYSINERVRGSLLDNKDISLSVLKKLSNDQNVNISSRAKLILLHKFNIS